MQVQMRSNNILLSVLLLLLIPGIGFSQNERSSIEGHTHLGLAFLHSGGYATQGSIYMLNQSFSYRFHPHFSVGLGTGFNIYPSLAAMPVYIDATYHFGQGKYTGYLHQTIGRNVKFSEWSFNSQRYTGGPGLQIEIKPRFGIEGEMGYLLLLDRFNGGNLSFYSTIGLYYSLGK